MTIDTTSSLGLQINVTTNAAYSHTCTNANLLIVGVMGTAGSNYAANSVTYGGVAMSKITASEQNFFADSTYACFFSLLGPPSGSNAIVVTMSGTDATADWSIGSISFISARNQPIKIAANTGVSSAYTLTPDLFEKNAYIISGIATDANVTMGLPSGFAQISSVATASPGSRQTIAYNGPYSAIGKQTVTWTPGGGPSAAISAIGVMPAHDSSIIINALRPHPFSPGIAR
jgi:hypothetical protein